MVDYQKMYATLAGRVDDVLHYMEGGYSDPGRMRMAAFFLQKALQEAEETYLNDTEDEVSGEDE